MGGVNASTEPPTSMPEVPEVEQRWLRRNGIDWDGLAS